MIRRHLRLMLGVLCACTCGMAGFAWGDPLSAGQAADFAAMDSSPADEPALADADMFAAAASCDDNSDCPSNRYCAKRDGDCDGRGQCKKRPRFCTEEYNPVCGCDGQTYSNACFAASAGVNVAHKGECGSICCDPADEPGTNGNPFCFEGHTCCADGRWRCNNADGSPSCEPGPVCGTIGKCCLETGACVDTDQDSCEEMCGSFAGVGTQCTGIADCPIPPIIVAACCLPNGSCTVDTQCQCEQQGGVWQSVADCSPGLCGGGGEVCGGIQGIPCEDPNDFCKLNVGECCCDFQGVCTPRPMFCPLIYNPVCGCDGVTYDNECFADAAGVSIDFFGPCDGGGGECRTNADCGPGYLFGEFCKKAVGDCDGVGECTIAPQYCLDVWIPVCGCDGNIYSNTCYANRAGVNVASEGACPF